MPSEVEIPAVAAGSTRYELRLLGTNGAGVDSALFGIKSVELTSGGQALTVHPVTGSVDLANLGHAFLIGYLDIPDGVDALKLKLKLDDFGGFQAGPVAGSVEAGVVELSAEMRTSQMWRHKRTVVELNLGKSIGDSARGHLLAPTYRVVH